MRLSLSGSGICMTGSGESGGEIGESGYGGGGREMKQMGSVRGRWVLVVVVLGHAMAAVEGRQRAFLSKQSKIHSQGSDQRATCINHECGRI